MKCIYTTVIAIIFAFGMSVLPTNVDACGFFVDSCYSDYSNTYDYGGMYTYQQYPYPYYTYNQTNSGVAPTSGQYTYVQYPYPVYTYNKNPGPRDPMEDYRLNYVQYPYQQYSYAQNPGPRNPMSDYNYFYYDYPDRVYTYYNQSESSQLAKYQTGYQQPTYGGYGSYGYGNQGFILTSGY